MDFFASRFASMPTCRWLSRKWVLPILAATILGCERDPAPAGNLESARPPAKNAAPPDAARLSQLWPLGSKMLNQAALSAEELSASIEQLLTTPDAELLSLSQRNWLATVANYEPFYLFTRLALVMPHHYEPLLAQHYNIAAWPIQPGYLDAYGPHAVSGLVFDISVPIAEDNLRQQHGMTDPSDVALGLYALQFLLFGEDAQRSSSAFEGIEGLSAEQQQDGYATATELPRNRRRNLMRNQAQMIADDIAELRGTWEAKGPDAMASHFSKLTAEQQRHVLTKAALTMVTEHIVAVSEQAQVDDQPASTINQQNHTLAQRLYYQLQGWQQVLEVLELPDRDNLESLTRNSLQQLQAVWEPTPAEEDSGTQTTQWQGVYRTQSELARQLQTSVVTGEPLSKTAKP